MAEPSPVEVLATPETTIGVNLRVTAHSSQGGRRYMEDMLCVAYQPTSNDKDLLYAYFGIFDGHGGKEAAVYTKQHLMDNIVRQKHFWDDDDDCVLKAIHDGFLATHHAMMKELNEWPKTLSGMPSTSGTTATMAFVRRSKLFIGHVGDSGLILGYQDPDSGYWRAKSLTTEHKPESATELARITESGGKVARKSGVPRVVWNRPRVGHQGPVRRSTPMEAIPFLAVARSLGDFWSYNADSNEFVVSPVPDVCVVNIDISSFRCLIFGSDGLWNMLNPQEAVNTVYFAERSNERQLLASPPETASTHVKNWINPSKRLVDRALDRWAHHSLRADNTSVITVVIDPPGPPKTQPNTYRTRYKDVAGWRAGSAHYNIPMSVSTSPSEGEYDFYMEMDDEVAIETGPSHAASASAKTDGNESVDSEQDSAQAGTTNAVRKVVLEPISDVLPKIDAISDLMPPSTTGKTHRQVIRIARSSSTFVSPHPGGTMPIGPRIVSTVSVRATTTRAVVIKRRQIDDTSSKTDDPPQGASSQAGKEEESKAEQEGQSEGPSGEDKSEQSIAPAAAGSERPKRRVAAMSDPTAQSLGNVAKRRKQADDQEYHAQEELPPQPVVEAADSYSEGEERPESAVAGDIGDVVDGVGTALQLNEITSSHAKNITQAPTGSILYNAIANVQKGKPKTASEDSSRRVTRQSVLSQSQSQVPSQEPSTGQSQATAIQGTSKMALSTEDKPIEVQKTGSANAQQLPAASATGNTATGRTTRYRGWAPSNTPVPKAPARQAIGIANFDEDTKKLIEANKKVIEGQRVLSQLVFAGHKLLALPLLLNSKPKDKDTKPKEKKRLAKNGEVKKPLKVTRSATQSRLKNSKGGKPVAVAVATNSQPKQQKNKEKAAVVKTSKEKVAGLKISKEKAALLKISKEKLAVVKTSKEKKAAVLKTLKEKVAAVKILKKPEGRVTRRSAGKQIEADAAVNGTDYQGPIVKRELRRRFTAQVIESPKSQKEGAVGNTKSMKAVKDRGWGRAKATPKSNVSEASNDAKGDNALPTATRIVGQRKTPGQRQTRSMAEVKSKKK